VYLNRRHRWNWAVAVQSLPDRIGYLTRQDRPDTNEIVFTEYIDRQPQRGAFGMAAYPFNTSTRVEFGGGAYSLSRSLETRTVVLNGSTREVTDVFEEKTKLGDTLYLAQGSVALVHDTSFFGATSPVFGTRYRLETGRTSGTLDFTTWLVDGRRYFMPKRPVTIAVRALHYGRYGRDSEHAQLLNLYLGAPEFVRGYGIGSFTVAECLQGNAAGECDVFNSLIGSRLLMANVEVRAPVVGLFRGDLDYGYLGAELAAFFDAGLTWSKARPWSLAEWSRPAVAVRNPTGVLTRGQRRGLCQTRVTAKHPLGAVLQTTHSGPWVLRLE
jgi:hypothetical protein